MLCGSHSQRTVLRVTIWPSSTFISDPSGDVVLLQLAPLGVEDLDLAVA